MRGRQKDGRESEKGRIRERKVERNSKCEEVGMIYKVGGENGRNVYLMGREK